MSLLAYLLRAGYASNNLGTTSLGFYFRSADGGDVRPLDNTRQKPGHVDRRSCSDVSLSKAIRDRRPDRIFSILLIAHFKSDFLRRKTRNRLPGSQAEKPRYT